MEELKRLESRLAGAIRRKKIVLGLAGLAALASILLGLMLILSSLAAILIVPVPIKLALLMISPLVLLYGGYRFLYYPIQSEADPIRAAVEIEKKHPDLKGRLVAALQFRHFDFSKTNFSQALIDLTGRQALELTAGTNFNEIVSGYPLYRKARATVAIAALTVVIGFLVPGIFSNALDVYSQPTTLVAPPPGFALYLVPGNAERVKYSDIEIGGFLRGAGFPEQVEIFYRFSEGRWQSDKLSMTKALAGSALGRDSLPFGLTLKQVRRSFDYYAIAGDIKSETYAINVVERPRVTGLKITLHYPDYSRLAPMTLDEDNGSFAALVGSRAQIEIEANRDIDEGYLVRSDSSRQRLTLDGSRTEATFDVDSSFSYFIQLRDKQGETNPDPIEYIVTAIPDEYPIVSVIYPGFDLNLDENMTIPFTLHISDDYGFSSLALKYQVISGGEKKPEKVAVISFSDRIQTDGEVTFNWDLEPFGLLPSDYILYHFELADNDRISGPKLSSTRVYAARLPSIDEIVMQSESEQEGRVTETERILKEQHQVAERLKQLSQQLKASQKIDWNKQKELENIAEQQEETIKKLDEMARQMEEAIKKQDNNNLLSEQILKKMMELQKLFKEVATPEMKEALKKLEEALKQMNKDELEQAMKDVQMSQEEMLKRLERTLELFKRMQIEQKMAALLKMAEEMLLEQNRVNVETEEPKSEAQFPRLAQRENKLQEQMESMKSEAGKLRDLVKDSPMAGSEPHEKFSQAIEKNQAADDMKKAEQSLKDNQKNSALQSGQAASEQLADLVSELRQIQMQVASDQGDQVAQQIRKAIDDANYLSQKQEDIFNRSSDEGQKQQMLNDMAAEQQILKEAAANLADKIDDLAKQSPFLAAELRTFLEESQKSMQGSCDNLGQGRGRVAVTQQRDAIYNLNRTSVRLMDGLQEQKQCNKGGTCNKPGMRMESICQNQNQINQETKGQCPNPGQNPSQSQKEALKRLAAEQGTVRKSLEQLQQEFGNRREVLGRLDNLAAEAQRIEDMLEEGQVGPELFDRQLKVYSRMLDVQKSLNRRDFTSERQAVTGQDIFRASPGPLGQETFQDEQSLRDRLNLNLQDGYPRQYEQQIKAYFKALSGSEQNAPQK